MIRQFWTAQERMRNNNHLGIQTPISQIKRKNTKKLGKSNEARNFDSSRYGQKGEQSQSEQRLRDGTRGGAEHTENYPLTSKRENKGWGSPVPASSNHFDMGCPDEDEAQNWRSSPWGGVLWGGGGGGGGGGSGWLVLGGVVLTLNELLWSS